ncbi:hypothetical protein GZ77_23690 [Endozoicomonas montiporae]|uniref:Porin n=1 Tax=Endozoicomonas montiporae TaxID=1027273 RepID=A0A081N0V7_9GAMM|nr:hypothetical protein GZ77_23690 [Endozoicomonas montiporae]
MSASCLASTGTSFIDDGAIDGKIRTVYYDVENTYQKDQGVKPYRDGAWTGGLLVNVRSGYLGDMFAIGGSFYGAAKINYDKDRFKDSYQLLKTGKNGKQEGFSKLGQAWFELKCEQEGNPFSGRLKVGRQELYTGLVSSSGSRTVPSTWEGVNLNTKLYETQFKFAYVNKMSLRNEDDFNKIENFDGRKIDYILAAELSHTFDLPNHQSLELKYRNAFSKSFLQAHNAEVNWKTPLSDSTSLRLGGMVFYTKEDGNLWTGEVFGKKSFDDKATAGNLNATLSVGSWSFDTAVSTFKAESKTHKFRSDSSQYAAPSVYYYDLGKNTHGIWGMPTSPFAEDMLYDGETVWMVGFGYDFTKLGAKGLEAGYGYYSGSGMKVYDRQGGSKKVSENEHDVWVKYAFLQTVLKGLVFKLHYGIYRNDKELMKAIDKEENDLRVWLDYNFVIF